nr:hypothetical protein 3 [bacterium]
MSLEIAQFNTEFRKQDRRQNSVFIKNERRSGVDRRENSIFSRLKNDVNKLDTIEKTLYTLSPLPPARRVCSMPEAIKEDNNSRALGLMGLAALNFPSDLKEIGIAAQEIKNVFKQGVKGFSGNPYQHEISFFKDTLLDKLPDKYKWLDKADKTLFYTKFGESFQKKFKLNIDWSDVGYTKSSLLNKEVVGYKFTGNYAQKTLARALHRIPVIGLLISSAFEIPTLIKSVVKTNGTILDKAKAFGKQLIKSAGYIGFTTAAISAIGAITFPISAVLGLTGMAVGSMIGLQASNKLNKWIDKI